MGGGGSKAGVSSGSLPQWVRQPHMALIQNAENFVYGDRGGYVPFPDQRIAGLTQFENDANAARRELFNRGDIAGQFAGQQLDAAAGFAGGIGNEAFNSFHTSDLQQRMSPFIEGVINPRLREANESFNQQINTNNAQSIARGGSMGDHRLGLERIALQGQRAETLADIRGAGQQQAYEQAYDSFLRDRDARIGGLESAANTLSGIAATADSVGSGSQARQLQQISELERSGAIERELLQRELDLGYQDFIEERDFPVQRMQFLSTILSGIPSAQLARTSTTTPQPGLMSQLASLGLGAAAVQQAFGGQGS